MSKWAEAQKYLGEKDAKLNVLAKKYGRCPLKPVAKKNYFGVLCSAIIAQQLSTKAAACIEGRFLEYIGKDVKPNVLLAADPLNLRGLGISQQKIIYLKDLADKFSSGAIKQAFLFKNSDAEVIEKLTMVKGIGIWTAQMFLIFALNRPDVWAVDDLGLRKAVMKIKEMPSLPEKTEMSNAADLWRPYRTLASWYLWRGLE